MSSVPPVLIHFFTHHSSSILSTHLFFPSSMLKINGLNSLCFAFQSKVQAKLLLCSFLCLLSEPWNMLITHSKFVLSYSTTHQTCDERVLLAQQPYVLSCNMLMKMKYESCVRVCVLRSHRASPYILPVGNNYSLPVSLILREMTML